MYFLSFSGQIIRESDRATIPEDEGNGDYQQYLAWLAKGNEPEREKQSLDLLKAQVAMKIETHRQIKAAAGIPFKDSWAQTDPSSIANINAEVSSVSAGIRQDGEPWRMGDNSIAYLTNAELVEMAKEIRAYLLRLYGVAWYHKDNLYSLESEEEILGYDWTIGWD